MSNRLGWWWWSPYAPAAIARKHAEDPLYESPFAVEAAAEKAGGSGKAKQSGPMGLFNAFAANAASVVTGRQTSISVHTHTRN